MEGMDFDREVLSRLPLAEAALLVLRQACSREDSREVFQRCRERCFENRLKFETFVDVLKDALLRFDGSARRACEQAREHRRLPVSDPAFYSKLRHLPIGLSEVFLADSSARLAPLLPDALPSPLPPSLRRFNVQILDGKVTKRVAKRLKILRGLAGGALGGKALVTLHYNSGLVFAMSGSPDGDANDASLVEDLVKQVLARLKTEEIILWIGDAQFADLTQTYRFRGPANKHHFLLRYSHSTKFVPDELAPEALEHPGLLEGTDQQGSGSRRPLLTSRPLRTGRAPVRRIRLKPSRTPLAGRG